MKEVKRVLIPQIISKYLKDRQQMYRVQPETRYKNNQELILNAVPIWKERRDFLSSKK